MLVNIKDRHYDAQVEAFLDGRDFHSFMAQDEEDRETFLKEVSRSIGRWLKCQLSSIMLKMEFQSVWWCQSSMVNILWYTYQP